MIVRARSQAIHITQVNFHSGQFGFKPLQSILNGGSHDFSSCAVDRYTLVAINLDLHH